MKAVFVAYPDHLEGLGGVQACTSEYLELTRATTQSVRLCLAQRDRRLVTRVLRRANSSAYFRPATLTLPDEIAQAVREEGAGAVVLNQVALAAFAPQLRARLGPSCRIVALSHGLESTDLLHLLRLRSTLPLSGRVRPHPALGLGGDLLAENRVREHLDGVCVLSPFDGELERWLGAPRVAYIPRVVTPDPLDWRPTGDRLGYLGTLDHAPNLEGLVETLEALREAPVQRPRVRVVGGPEAIGRWLAARFSRVDYLGPLGDGEARAEAATWSAFLHPILRPSRGCSTKLATALAWGVPVVTTEAGRRGYEWREGGLVIEDGASGVAAAALRLLDAPAAREAREGVLKAARSSPSVAENAARLQALISPEG